MGDLPQWPCPSCTYLNHAALRYCETCNFGPSATFFSLLGADTGVSSSPSARQPGGAPRPLLHGGTQTQPPPNTLGLPRPLLAAVQTHSPSPTPSISPAPTRTAGRPPPFWTCSVQHPPEMMIVGNVCRRCGGREPRVQTISTPTTSPSAPHAGAANAISGPAKAPAQSPATALPPALAVAPAPAAKPASAPAPRPVSAFDFGRLQEFDATVDVGDAAKTVLPSGDVFVFSTAPVDVTDGTEKRGHGGRLVLTSQRVLWASGALKLAWPLGALRDPVLEAPSLFSLFHAPHVFLPVIDAEGHAGKAPCVKLSFKGGSDAANAASVFVTSLTSARASLS